MTVRCSTYIKSETDSRSYSQLDSVSDSEKLSLCFVSIRNVSMDCWATADPKTITGFGSNPIAYKSFHRAAENKAKQAKQ